MSRFFKIRDFFLKSVLWKTAEFSVSDTGDPLILTCLPPTLSLKKNSCKSTIKKILALLQNKEIRTVRS